MKGEIRNLLAGKYLADDGECKLDISKEDDGVHISLEDEALGIIYHYIIDGNGLVIDFKLDLC